MGIWMVKSLNLSTHITFPVPVVHKHTRIKLDSLIYQHIQNENTLYAAKIAELLAENKKQSVPFKAALGLANAVKESPEVAEQLAIIAREHPSLKVRCYWQAQLNQGTIITMVNSPGPYQVVSQYLVLPETHCPAKELDLPPASSTKITTSLLIRDDNHAQQNTKRKNAKWRAISSL
jgi:hypothetical protein